MKTKEVIYLFIILQLLDLFTTIMFLSIGIRELNPLATSLERMILLKIIGILAVPSIILLYESKALKLVALIFSGLIVIWNILNIILEVI